MATRCCARVMTAIVCEPGRFGRLDGFGFLQMVRRKVAWILGHMNELIDVLED